MSKAEYKRLGDYIREVIIRNREHRAMQAYTFGDGSEMEDVPGSRDSSLIRT